MKRWYAPAYEEGGELVVLELEATRRLAVAQDAVTWWNTRRPEREYVLAAMDEPEWKRL